MRVADYFFGSEGSKAGCVEEDATGCEVWPFTEEALWQSLAE